MELGLDKLPWYGQIATFLLVAVAGFVVFHLYWVIPVTDEMSLAEEELAELRLEINEALQTASQLRQVEAEVEDLTGRLESLSAALPAGRDASALLRQVQTLAAQSNLSIRAFTPQAVEQMELHSAWPIRLELNGTYHNLGLFFDRVSKFSQVIAISDVVIRAIDPPQLNATISAECTATTFVLNENGADTPFAARAGTMRGPSNIHRRDACTTTVVCAVAIALAATALDGRTALSTQTAAQTGIENPTESQSVDAADSLQTEAYTYDPERRRDPFVSLLTRGADLGPLNERPAGLAGLSINDVSLRGLVLSKGEYLAVMQAPDSRTYILRGEEVLFDGVVKSVTSDGITFLQEVNDPLSIVKEREVLRTLRGQEEGR